MVGKWLYAVKWLSTVNRATYFHSEEPTANSLHHTETKRSIHFATNYKMHFIDRDVAGL